MALKPELQNPKRSQFDPTESEARLASIEQTLADHEQRLAVVESFVWRLLKPTRRTE